MLNKLTLRMRLIATMILLGLLIAAIGLMGIFGMQSVNASLGDVYSNQLASSVAISNAKNTLSRARFNLDRAALHPDDADIEKTLNRAEMFITEADKQWQQYRVLPQSAEEGVLARTVEAEAKRYVEDGLLALSKAIRAGDAALVDTLAMKQLQTLYGTYNKASEALDAYQVQSAKANFDASQTLYDRVLTASIAALAIGAVLMVASSTMLLRAIMQPLNHALHHFDAMAAGDLSTRIEIVRHDEMGTLLKGLARMQEQLATTVRQVREGSGAIAVASSEIATGNMDLSRRTEQQAGSLEETASSLEELTSTVRQNADNARQANQLAVSASDVAVKGGQLVSRVVETMGAIDASSKRIVDIIAVIDGIAFQTNILALNAAVEAARAGEQGRGFAVVATEVRNLAQRSAAAAREIKELINESVGSVDAGAQLVGQAGTTMGDIVSSVARVTDIMAEIMAAGEEQSAGIDQINSAIAQMDEVTQQNASLVEEAAAAADSLQDQARNLEQLVSVFKVDAAQAAQPARRAAGRTALALQRA